MCTLCCLHCKRASVQTTRAPRATAATRDAWTARAALRFQATVAHALTSSSHSAAQSTLEAYAAPAHSSCCESARVFVPGGSWSLGGPSSSSASPSLGAPPSSLPDLVAQPCVLLLGVAREPPAHTNVHWRREFTRGRAHVQIDHAVVGRSPQNSVDL